MYLLNEIQRAYQSLDEQEIEKEIADYDTEQPLYVTATLFYTPTSPIFATEQCKCLSER